MLDARQAFCFILVLVIDTVIISQRAKKALKKVPRHTVEKLKFWVTQVESVGLDEVCKVSGFHDDSSRSYRALCVIEKKTNQIREETPFIEFVLVQNVYGN